MDRMPVKLFEVGPSVVPQVFQCLHALRKVLFEWLKVAFSDRLNNTLNVIAHYLLIFAAVVLVAVLLASGHLRYKLMDQLLLFLLLARVSNAQWALVFGWEGRFDQVLVALGLLQHFLHRAVFPLEGANISLWVC